MRREKRRCLVFSLVAAMIIALFSDMGFIVHAEDVYHTVTFHSEGGSSVASQQVLEGNKATVPTSPTKEGFIFDGWCMHDENGNFYCDWDFSLNGIYTDLDLYAKWERNINSIECSVSSSNYINGVLNSEFSKNVTCTDVTYRSELLGISDNYYLANISAIADGTDISEQVKNGLVSNGYISVDVSGYSSLTLNYYWTGTGDYTIGNGVGTEVLNTRIRVFDEYLLDENNADRVTRVDTESNDFNAYSTWSYSPSSTRNGYQYNGNLSIYAFDSNGVSVDANTTFESVDASTGAVSFIPDGFREVYIIYQYSDGSVPARPSAGYYNLTVRDHFGLQTSIREKKVVPDGTPYNYDALSREGWIVVCSTNYNGVVTGDTVLDFYYEREADPQPEPQPTPEPQPVVQQYTITVYDHFGTSVELREQKTVDNGTVYSYSALERDDWKCTGYTNCDGVVNNADVIIDFYYGEVIIPPAPEPQIIPDPEPSPEPDPTPLPIREPDPIPDPQPTPDPTPTPSSEPESNEPVLDDEPKTGDTTSSIPFILSVLGLIGAVVYKKRKEI